MVSPCLYMVAWLVNTAGDVIGYWGLCLNPLMDLEYDGFIGRCWRVECGAQLVCLSLVSSCISFFFLLLPCEWLLLPQASMSILPPLLVQNEQSEDDGLTVWTGLNPSSLQLFMPRSLSQHWKGLNADALRVKSVCCSCRGPDPDLSTRASNSEPPWLQIQGNLTPLASAHSCAHPTYRHTHAHHYQKKLMANTLTFSLWVTCLASASLCSGSRWLFWQWGCKPPWVQ